MFSRLFGSHPLRLAALALLSLPFAVTAQPIRITGRVAGSGAPGVFGARVEIFPAQEGYAEAVRRLKREPGPAPLATADTDADGRFRIAAPGPGCFRVVVRANGYLPMEYPLAPLVEERELPPVVLEEENSLEIRLAGAEGRPLPGIAARLEAEEYPGLGAGGEVPPRWRFSRWNGTSGPDGKLALPRMLGESSRLAILSPEFLGQGMEIQGHETGPMLRLLPGPITRIEVRDAAGDPVSGALIRWRGEPVAVTGPRGRAEIAAPQGEALTVESATGGQAKIVPAPGNGILPVRLEPPRRIAGKVVDETGGRPVQNAVLWVGWPPATPPILSDADGSFQLELPPGGEGWAESGAAGFLPGSRRFVRKGEPGPLLLKLAPAATIAGSVVDSAGHPVPGAGIDLEGAPGGEPFRTGPDGKFRLPGLRPGSAYKLTASHEGFAPTAATVRTAPAGRASSPARIVLHDGARVSGRLAGEDGSPVAGAELALVSPEDQIGSRAARARSDSEGKFAFRHLLPGVFNLIALHPRHAKLRVEGIEVSAGAPVDLGRLTMPDGTFIEGQVVDGQGSPVAEAEIMTMSLEADVMDLHAFRDGGASNHGRVTTGPDGKFRLEGLNPGSRYELMAVHPAYGMASAPGVKAPTEKPVRIEMRRMRILSGRVVGPEGEPVAGAELSWVQESRTGSGFGMSTSSIGVTDNDGRFQAPDVSPDLGDLVARAQGYLEGRVSRTQIPAEGEVTDLRIVLERGSILDVRVVGAEGEPIPGVWVSASLQRAPGEPQIFSSSFPQAPRVTDAEGRSRISVTPGAYEVSALVKGRAIQEKAVVGAGTTSVELRLPAGAEVAGRVVREDGTGVAGAMVQLIGSAGSSSGLQVEPDGSFSFSSLSDGSYRLKAQEMDPQTGTLGMSSAPLEVVVAGQPVRGLELRLSRKPEGARLTGRLLRFPPDEIPLVQILAFGEEGTHKGKVDPSGSYSVEGLPPGSWTVRAALPSGREAKTIVQVRPGDSELTRDLDLSPGVTISGHVLVDGVPLAGAEVQSLDAVRESRQDRTAYDGSFALQGVNHGPVTLLVGAPGGLGTSRRLMIRETQEIDIEIATGRLLGRTVSAAGEPIADATVEVSGWVEDLQMPFTTLQVRSGTDGLFEVPRLGAGLYRIVAVKPGFAPAETRAVVKPGQENAVEVRLTPR